MERLLNAAILLVVGFVVCGVVWLVSLGFYAMGLWPLGAAARVVTWGLALFFLYWVVRHLIESPEARLRRDIMRVTGRDPFAPVTPDEPDTLEE